MNLASISAAYGAVVGERNWWMPRWLDRVLPRLSIERRPELAPTTASTIA